MTYKKLTPNLIVDDITWTLEFYRDILKFELLMTISSEDDKKLVWALLKKGQIEIMLQARENISREIPIMKHKEAGGSLTLYIELNGVADLYEQLCEQVVLVEELHTKSYGMREFSIEDCNGFVLTFAERVE